MCVLSGWLEEVPLCTLERALQQGEIIRTHACAGCNIDILREGGHAHCVRILKPL